MAGQTVILIGPNQRDFAHNLINKAPHGAILNIREANRTPDQNAKMWAMLSDISRAMPDGRRHTSDMWKALMMKACGHEVQFLNGIDGEPFPVGFRSSNLSKPQMAELITFIQMYGDQRRVKWTWNEGF